MSMKTKDTVKKSRVVYESQVQPHSLDGVFQMTPLPKGEKTGTLSTNRSTQ
jgi:hypothetical protein